MKRLIVLTMALLFSVPPSAQAQDVERYVRYEQGGDVHWGILEGETVHQLSGAPYLGGRRTGRTAGLSSVELRAPVEPTQIFMTAFNFRSHIDGEPAEFPGLFLIPPSSVIGPGQPLVRPPDSDNFHFEAELVAVVSDTARNVPLDEAGSYVFGVSAGNDGSERTWQSNDIQWTRAKGGRSFNAVGPHLVVGLDYENLDIEGRLNGEWRQGENSSDMVFGMNYMLHYISQYFTLYPGDLIWSGTMGTTEAMEPGDVYEVEVEGVGVLRNELVQGRR